MGTEFDARILKLRLPEQEDLKNESERCSADPVILQSIGREVGHQVRIERKDTGFVALYTVKQANPPDGPNPVANVVRAGETARDRLGTTSEIEAIVHGVVLDPPPTSEESIGVRLFDAIDDDVSQ